MSMDEDTRTVVSLSYGIFIQKKLEKENHVLNGIWKKTKIVTVFLFNGKRDQMFYNTAQAPAKMKLITYALSQLVRTRCY